jgi:hypothetical protein
MAAVAVAALGLNRVGGIGTRRCAGRGEPTPSRPDRIGGGQVSQLRLVGRRCRSGRAWVAGMELIIRGNLVWVGVAFKLVIGPRIYFRPPETTIELSRNPLRIYGIDSRREWISVRGR